MADDSTIPVSVLKQRVAEARRNPCLVQIYPFGADMGARHVLTDQPLVMGRDENCDVHINDDSVSRRHARIQPGADGYYAVDLQEHQRHLRQRRAGLDVQAQGRRLPARRQLHLPLPGRRQRRGRVPRRNLPPDHHRRPDRHPQQALPAGVPRPRAVALGPPPPAAGAGHVRHGPLQGDQRRAGPPGRRLHACASWPPASRRSVRKEELFARYGGEEFAVVLPETTHEGAVVLAERCAGSWKPTRSSTRTSSSR